MAGLNHELGEYIPKLGKFYAIGRLDDWAGSPFLDLALQHAADVFATAKGRTNDNISFGRDDILIQLYPLLNKVVFLFVHMVNGKEMYTHYECEINPEGIEILRQSGIWPDTQLPSVN